MQLEVDFLSLHLMDSSPQPLLLKSN